LLNINGDETLRLYRSFRNLYYELIIAFPL
jgi:hypothetical protein